MAHVRTKGLFAAAMTAVVSFTAADGHAELQGLERVGTGFARPVFVTQAPGDSDRLFVVEQAGRVRVIDLNTGTVQATPFLDITGFVDDSGSEQGLLGLTFDPDYQTNGHFYVNYTRDPGPGLDRTRIDRYSVTNPTDATASTSTRHSVFEFEQDFGNHNGGWIGFSPNDNHLYIATGDGGSGNDPLNRGQSLDTHLGKMLRIDPTGDDFPLSSTANYAIPADNPFVDGNPNTFDEIWAYGLRNPWRNSFDSQTGDLWIGDVGQGEREEINFQPGTSTGGENYGWRLREGDIATPGGVGGPNPPGSIDPVYDYPHGGGDFEGFSTVGGHVYRGVDPDLQGLYFFADSFPGQTWTFDPSDPDATVTNIGSQLIADVGFLGNPVSFGEDHDGNLYIVDLNGHVFKILTDDAPIFGDLNGDGALTNGDIAPFVQALTDRAGYDAAFPNLDADTLGDFTGDGLLTNGDIAGFVAALTGGGAATPEPGSLALLALGGSFVLLRRTSKAR